MVEIGSRDQAADARNFRKRQKTSARTLASTPYFLDPVPCLVAKINESLVILPGMDDPDAFWKWRSDTMDNEVPFRLGRPHPLGWPVGMEMLLDKAEIETTPPA